MPSEFAKKVIAMLSPSLGEFMAKRKVVIACNLANVDIEKMGKTHRKDFSEKLEIACEQLGPTVAQSIRKSVESLG